MIKIVNKYEFKKVLNEKFEIEIPNEPFAYQEYNHRVLTLVVPKWTTWNSERFDKKEEIWECQIIRVERDGKIERGMFRTNDTEMERLIANLDAKVQSNKLANDVLRYLIHYPTDDRVSVEYFKQYFDDVITSIKGKF